MLLRRVESRGFLPIRLLFLRAVIVKRPPYVPMFRDRESLKSECLARHHKGNILLAAENHLRVFHAFRGLDLYLFLQEEQLLQPVA